MNKLRLTLSILSFSLLLTAISCDEDPSLPDNVVEFVATELGMNDSETELDIMVRVSRALDADATISIGFTTDGIEYGTEFTTDPATVADQISITIPKGSTEGSFTIIKADDLVLDGDETVEFSIEAAGSGLVHEASGTLVLSFAEILSTGAEMDVNGGGVDFPNKVFIDLSANRQSAVERSNWHLGFYSGDVYRVALNSSTAMFARQIDKNDLTAVTAADTTGFGSEMVLSFSVQPNTSTAWIDAPSGSLEGTAIAEVSETASENKVYIVKPEEGDWKKIRVLRTATGYAIQYANIAAAAFEQTSIDKDAAASFQYFHFTQGVVTVEPSKARWDIAWTYFINTTALGPGALIPYGFQDVVLTNIHGGAKAIQILETASITYASFSAADLTGLVLDGTSQLAIGSNWRVAGMSGASVSTDRFYVVEDASGNFYKIRFLSLTKDGVRGYPSFEYELL